MKKILFLGVSLFFFISCETEEVENPATETLNFNLDAYLLSGKLENEPRERMRNAVLELTNLSKKAFLRQDVVVEVGTIVKSNFYMDNVVDLKDLLNPETSLAYKYTPVEASIKGAFKEFYYNEVKLNEGLYLNLVALVEKNENLFNKNSNIDFYSQASLTYYLPYDENDHDIAFDTTTVPTLVPAVIDADSGLAQSYEGNQWNEVISNDQKASSEYTLIISPSFDDCSGLGFAPNPTIAVVEEIDSGCDDISGGSPSGSSGGSGNSTPANIYTGSCNDLKSGGTYIRQVFVGRAKNTNGRQFDSYVSFTGNGGGSEIRYCRADSQQAIDIDSLANYTNTQWDTRVSQYWTRKQIRRQNVRQVSALWDQNWECEGTHEQLFVIYEEDNEGDLIIDQDLSFQLADDTYSADIDVTIQNRSKDDAIIIRKRERVEFFATNLLDQGGGCWDGDASFNDRCWGIFDGGADMAYTMYHRWVFVNDNTGL